MIELTIRPSWILVAIVIGASWSADIALAGPSEDVAVVYRPDVRFPEFTPLWREGWNWKDENGQRVRYAYEGMPLGGYLFAYFRNQGDDVLEVKDLLIDGVSLAEGLIWETPVKHPGMDKTPSSLQFSKLGAGSIAKLERAGEPVWWKVEPTHIPPGGMAELTIRLRRDPKHETLTLCLPDGTGKMTKTILQVNERSPRFFSINFTTPQLDQVHAYLRHHKGIGMAPRRVLVNGKDVTSRCTISADERIDTVAVVIRLEQPLTESEYCFFQADYPDGSSARAGIGAWYLETVYGMWGSHRRGDSPEQCARDWITDMLRHNVNVLMLHSSGPGHAYVSGPEGPALLKELGMRKMYDWVDPERDPIFYFLIDEPDAADFGSKMLDPYKRIGSLGQYLVERCKLFRRHDPQRRPILLNIDNTFKPENWYTYAQLSDIPCADPYYQECVQTVLHSDPTNMAAYIKPTYVYAVGSVYQSAGAPDPMHLILHTCRFDFKPEETPYRAPTPEEKRIEVYYALAAGAKQLSFWWYSPGPRYHGLGSLDADLQVLWKEVGLLGAEVRMLDSVIARSCPARLAIEAPRMLWIRSLLAGKDTIVVLVVNDNTFSDRLGTVVRPIHHASFTMQVPVWLEPRDAFEVGYRGTTDCQWKAGDGEVKFNLDTVELTRLVILTSNTTLRRRLQNHYDENYADNVKHILSKDGPKP
ncbi:MAG: hypothetical protein ACYTBZ_16245 [Planctomycetota bacterium]|jgi:hypothetical protein